MTNGRLSKESRNRIRRIIIEQLKEVPEGERIKLDTKLLDDLIFFKYYDEEVRQQIKIPIWTGVFLRKLDLSELSFENANLDVSEYNEENKEYFEEGAISHMDKKSINEYIQEYMECNDKKLIESDYTLDFSYTNIKIDFENLDINCISNCNFEGVDFSNIGEPDIAFYSCNLQKTNIKPNKNIALRSCNLGNNDFSNTTLDARNITDEDEKIYFCNFKNTGLNIIYKFDLDENSKKSYEEIEKIEKIKGYAELQEIDDKIRKVHEIYGSEVHHYNELYYAEELKKLIEMGYLDGCYLNGKLIDSKKYEKDIIARITSSIEEQKNNFKK